MRVTKTIFSSIVFLLFASQALCALSTTAESNSLMWTVTVTDPVQDTDLAARVEHTIVGNVPLQNGNEMPVVCAPMEFEDMQDGQEYNAFEFIIYCFNGNGPNGHCTDLAGIEVEYYDAKLTRNGDNVDFEYLNNWSESVIAEGDVTDGLGNYTYMLFTELSASEANDFHVPTSFDGSLTCYFADDLEVDHGLTWAYQSTTELNNHEGVMESGASVTADIDGDVGGDNISTALNAVFSITVLASVTFTTLM